MINLKKALLFLYIYLSKRTEEASHHIPLFGIVMMINFPLFGVLWKFEFFQLDEEFFLRLAAAILCLILATCQFWPRLLLRMLPIYWYITLLFCLPFFFTYATLLNHVTTHWLMNCITAFFFLLLLTNIFDTLILLSIGISMAIICFSYFAGHSLDEIPKHSALSLYSLNSTLFAVIAIGFLFTKKSEISFINLYKGLYLDNHKLALKFNFYSNQGLMPNDYFGNEKKRQAPLPLKQSTVIKNIDPLEIKNFSIFSMKRFLKKITRDYANHLDKIHLIHLSVTNDFSVWIEGDVLKHFLWNFLANSMQSIEKNGYGDINIWMVLGNEEEDFNYVHLKNIKAAVDENQFDDFSNKIQADRNEISIESFMKMAGGDIYCENDISHYSHYILKFPKVD